jgi:hypothetical protein
MPTTAPVPTGSPAQDDGKYTRIVVGIIVGSVVGAILLGLLFYWLYAWFRDINVSKRFGAFGRTKMENIKTGLSTRPLNAYPLPGWEKHPG